MAKGYVHPKPINSSIDEKSPWHGQVLTIRGTMWQKRQAVRGMLESPGQKRDDISNYPGFFHGENEALNCLKPHLNISGIGLGLGWAMVWYPGLAMLSGHCMETSTAIREGDVRLVHKQWPTPRAVRAPLRRLFPKEGSLPLLLGFPSGLGVGGLNRRQDWRPRWCFNRRCLWSTIQVLSRWMVAIQALIWILYTYRSYNVYYCLWISD